VTCVNTHLPTLRPVPGKSPSNWRRIVLPLVAYAVVAAGVLAGVLLYLRTDAITYGEKLGSAFAQLADEQTARTVQNVEHTLQSADNILSAATGTSRAGEDPIGAQLRGLLRDYQFLKAIWVLDEHGRNIYNTDMDYKRADFSDRPYFLYHRNSPGSPFHFGAPLRNRSTGEWFIPATRALRRANGEFAGVIVGAVDPRFFERVWTLDNAIADLSIALFREDGVLLTRSPFDEHAMGVSIGDKLVFSRIRSGNGVGTYQTISLFDGQPLLLAYRRLTDYPGLVIVAGESMGQVLASWTRFAGIVASCWVGAVAALGGLAVWRIREGSARRATENRYRMFFDANPYPMMVFNRDTRRILAVNDAAVADYGWSREEALAMNADELYPPDDLVAAKTMRLKGDLDRVNDLQGLHLRKKNGTIIDVEMTMRPMDLDGRPAVLATAHDVTERNRADQVRLAMEDQLRQSQKMEAVGQLTGGIAHDFNNILHVILANTDALVEEETLAGDVKGRLGQIAKAVERASGLTKQLLAFSRKQPLHPQLTDLNDLVTDTGKLLRRALGAEIEIESILSDGLCIATIDRAQLETALVNLCINARDAMPEGGRLLIETHNVTLDEEYVALNPDATAGPYAMLSVTDNGGGISPEALSKVFEPFFTTKEVGKGTGLGLSMVYGFIKQSHGHVTITSKVGVGTTVRLYLPCSNGEPDAADTRNNTPVPRGTERILVVEDEPQVRASVVQQLQSLGYEVSEAPDGGGGIAAFDTARQPYDLLLTDIVMPGALNGKALAAEVVRRWPQTKVVFMSGFTETSSARHGRLDEGALLLSKPFRRLGLARIVRKALDVITASSDAEAATT
jgi:PAS domain S-box-containing protein